MLARLSWCWFALALALSLAFVGATSRVRARTLDAVSAVSTGSTPVGGAGAGRNRIVPATAFDGLFWISYAQRMAATGEWRVRETAIDNAPFGREVHWSSSLAWWLVALGEVRHAFTAEPLPQAVEYAAAYANPVLLLLLLVALAVGVARRFGPAVGGLAAAVAASLPHMVNSFAVNEPDHHGLINAAALGTVLCLIAGGLGWERRDAGDAHGLLPATGHARRWFIASACFGAIGLWLSAVSQIFVFAGVALGAVAAILIAGVTRNEAIARPELWRTWGRWGAGLALGFYVLEYFPSHFAMRLEVNHPLHAAAWWGAGEWIAALATWRHTGTPLWPRETRARIVRGAATLGFIAPPAAAVIGGVAWLRALDPVNLTLTSLVLEGQSIVENIRRSIEGSVWRDLGGIIVLLAAGLSAVFVRGLTRIERAIAFAAWLAVLPTLAATFHQNRWMLIVGGLSPLLAITAAVAWRRQLPRWARGAAFAGLAALVASTFAWDYARLSYAIATAPELRLAPDDAFVVAMRHHAQELRRRVGPDADVIVLAGPNESALLAYYGRFRTVGTLYWENTDGLRAASALYATPSLDDAKRLLAARRIAYWFSCPPGNFVEGYAAVANHGPDHERAQRSIGALVFAAGKFPQWLRPIWLNPPPPQLNGPGARCFEFAPGQTEAEQLLSIQRYRQEETLHAAQ